MRFHPVPRTPGCAVAAGARVFSAGRIETGPRAAKPGPHGLISGKSRRSRIAVVTSQSLYRNGRRSGRDRSWLTRSRASPGGSGSARIHDAADGQCGSGG